jgi:hypothetical protein
MMQCVHQKKIGKHATYDFKQMQGSLGNSSSASYGSPFIKSKN